MSNEPQTKRKVTVNPYRPIDIVFDGPPGPEGGRFVEVEQEGVSVCLGVWIHRPDGYWALRFRPVTALLANEGGVEDE